MQLVRQQETWDPFRELEDLSTRFNRLLGVAKWPGNGERELLRTTDWSPSCDISETDKEYRIHAELPSVRKEDVQVTLEGGLLTVRGERKAEKEEKGEKFHRRELTFGSFMRTFSMPDDADESKVDATFKDGMLNVVISKSPVKQARTRQIAIH